MSKYLLGGRKTVSEPVSGATTPKTPNGATSDPVFEPIHDEDQNQDAQWSGHLGHLNEAQTEALKVFREKITEAGLYQPASESEGREASHDEVTLLRFLRARSFQPDAAFDQFQSTCNWRKEHDVDNLFVSGFTSEEFDHARRFYPRWTGRRTKQGLPLFAWSLKTLEPIYKELDSVSAEKRYQRIIVLYEGMINFTLRLCSYIPHPSYPTPISGSMNIIDLADVSFATVFRLRNHFQEASKLATANYPETLGAIVIVNAPSFFPTVWSWIKGWFDEGTRKKIHILSKDPESLATLLTLVEAKDLPKMYGGELEWTFMDPPMFDDDIKAVIPDGVMPPAPAIFNMKTGKVEKPKPPSQSVATTTPAPTTEAT